MKKLITRKSLFEEADKESKSKVELTGEHIGAFHGDKTEPGKLWALVYNFANHEIFPLGISSGILQDKKMDEQIYKVDHIVKKDDETSGTDENIDDILANDTGKLLGYSDIDYYANVKNILKFELSSFENKLNPLKILRKFLEDKKKILASEQLTDSLVFSVRLIFTAGNEKDDKYRAASSMSIAHNLPSCVIDLIYTFIDPLAEDEEHGLVQVWRRSVEFDFESVEDFTSQFENTKPRILATFSGHPQIKKVERKKKEPTEQG